MEKKYLKFLNELEFKYSVSASEKTLSDAITFIQDYNDKTKTIYPLNSIDTPNSPEYRALKQLINRNFLKKIAIDPEYVKVELNLDNPDFTPAHMIQQLRDEIEKNSQIVAKTDNKKEVIEQMGGRCLICGDTDLDKMELHHIYPEDERGIYTKTKRKANGAPVKSVLNQGWSEIIKTVPLCTPCHKKITNSKPPYSLDVKIPREILEQYYKNYGKKLLTLHSEELRRIHRENPNTTIEDLADSYFQDALNFQSPETSEEERTNGTLDAVTNATIRDSLSLITQLEKRRQKLTLGQGAFSQEQGEELVSAQDEEMQALDNAIATIRKDTNAEIERLIASNRDIGDKTLALQRATEAFDGGESITESKELTLEDLMRIKEEMQQQLVNLETQIQRLQQTHTASRKTFEQIIKLQNAVQEEQQLIEEIQMLQQKIEEETGILNQEIEKIVDSDQETQKPMATEETTPAPDQNIDPTAMEQPPMPLGPTPETPPEAAPPMPPAPPMPSPEELQAEEQQAEMQTHPLENLDEKSLKERWNKPVALPPPPQGMPAMASVKKSYSIHEELKNQ
jgi:hypothetical protein